jgi:hypothetical protein
MDFASNLESLIREVEDHVASAGWDQPVRLFALVPTASLLSANPELALELGINAEMPLTSVEQEIEDTLELDELLGTIAWPEDVAGAIVALERIVLPPSAESDLPATDDSALVQAASDHPDRRDVRIVSAVLRNGLNLNALRYRTHDSADAVAVAPNLVARLNDALASTFED